MFDASSVAACYHQPGNKHHGSWSSVFIWETHMGMLDGLLGGIVGAGLVSVVSGIVEKHGGLQGVVNEFEKSGLGATVQSWVGTGPNKSISPDEVQRAIGPDLLQQLAAKSGLWYRSWLRNCRRSCRMPSTR